MAISFLVLILALALTGKFWYYAFEVCALSPMQLRTLVLLQQHFRCYKGLSHHFISDIMRDNETPEIC